MVRNLGALLALSLSATAAGLQGPARGLVRLQVQRSWGIGPCTAPAKPSAVRVRAAKNVSLNAVEGKGDGKQDGEGSSDGRQTQTRTVEAVEDKVDAWTYVFGKPGELDRDLARMGTTRERFLRINFFALLFALFANFLGMTSFLLGLLPELQGLYIIPAELTQFYPVKGWKRYRGDGAFEFIYPAQWLQDQAVTLANQARGVEDRIMTSSARRPRKAPLVQTVAGFGPPRGDASENVSVVRSKLPGELALKSLGTPEMAAQRLLDTAIAPPGSGKEATLLEAYSERRGSEDYHDVYQFEYIVDFDDGRKLHNVCAIGSREQMLYTLTVLAPEKIWVTKEDTLMQVAESFRLL